MLGPLLITTAHGRPVGSLTPKPSRLLIHLLLRSNEWISTSRLIDSVWDGHPPASARSNLKTYIAQLRRLLAEDGDSPISTSAEGYALRLGVGALDVRVFQTLAERGGDSLRAGDPLAAAAALDYALSLWRGDFLHGHDLRGDLTGWQEELQEQRLVASEDLYEARLALGQHDELIHGLLSWTMRHPLRERAHGLLMLALYRSGRQVEALDIYRRLRTALIRDVGVEPTTRLREIQQVILLSDPVCPSRLTWVAT
ncbi:AfsR/SARP family transcriptional regulator [Acrocarpospora phusangensis]|nr:AfsR/SARP family transcriptional regulator [Acrocarpospora phusangensis]